MPSIGDVVLVRVDPDSNDGSGIAPAIVTRVRPAVDATADEPAVPELVSARVQTNSVDNPQWRGELQAAEDLEALDEEEAYGYYQPRA